LTGTTLWEYLDDHYPGQYLEKLLRTLQRRVEHWRAVEGPERAVIFCQSVPAGQQGLSDFTRPRTDSFSAAYINTTQKRELTQAYEALCQHYGMKPTVNNPGISHANGAIENAHGSLKHRIEQAIKVRGSADFLNLEAYRRFLDQVVNKLNKRCQGSLVEEQLHLKSLPRYRFMDFSELTVKMTTAARYRSSAGYTAFLHG
jgi:hypothetical protein